MQIFNLIYEVTNSSADDNDIINSVKDIFT